MEVTEALTTAVLYARYSTDMQSAASAEDQLRLLRQRADREGWTIVAEHADRAISGTVRDRPGLNACLAAIDDGAARIILAEALDRISRDQEDIAGIYKRVRFAGARIVTLSEGDVGSLHIGMGGTISAVYIEQLAEKTRRGQIGRVNAGRIPGGLSYGYRAVRQLGPDGEPERGLRELDPDQAAVVRRIFADYVAGKSPLAIAAALNAEGVPSPRGGKWRANAIAGHRKRGNGIIHNRLYIGEIVYNRQAFRKDPDSRRRVSRLNDPAERVTAAAPELRIVDQDLWDRAQARVAVYAERPGHHARRPRRLLSGLLKCGCCGGSYILVMPGRWGCSDRKQTGTCGNGVTITDAQAQRRLWRAIETQLLAPDLIEAYIAERQRLWAEERRTLIAGRADAERRLAQLELEDRRIADALLAGLPIETLRERAEALAAERDQLRRDIDAKPLPAAAIHPGLAEHYRRAVAELHAIAESTDDVRDRSRALIADLVDKIEITPRANGTRGADLIVHGKLAAILHLETQKGPAGEGEADCMSKLVAGVGFGRSHTIRFAA